MKHFWVIVVLALFSGKLYAVKKDSFKEKIDSVNYWLAKYEPLSPFSNHDQAFDSISYIQEKIVRLFLEILNDKRCTNYSPEQLFSHGVDISYPDDRRIYFFSINEKTGGSYVSNITIFHCRFRDGSVLAACWPEENGGGLFYHDIYTLNTSGQYLALGSVITCNTCIAARALTIQLDTISHTYSVSLVMGIDCRRFGFEIFRYDPQTRTLTYSYSIRTDDSLYGDASGGMFNCHYSGMFKYNGESFVEVEECERREEVE